MPETVGGPLNAIDRLLVEALIADGRCRLASLAEKCGLSVSATQARIRGLESRGIIRGYRAIVDPEHLGYGISAFVELEPLTPDDETIPDALRGWPGIDACYAVSGSAQYLAVVRAPDPAALDAMLRDIRATINATAKATIVLRTCFEH